MGQKKGGGKDGGGWIEETLSLTFGTKKGIIERDWLYLVATNYLPHGGSFHDDLMGKS